MKPKQPVDVLEVFAEERRPLLALLAGLSPEGWHTPTACAGWSVKDLAAHILACNLGDLSRGRDRYVDPSSPFVTVSSWEELVTLIDRQNEGWVRAARRLSPGVLLELLEWSGEHHVTYFGSLDPMELGSPVSWAGPAPAPRWLHMAREYTERWVHQQQIREALGEPGLEERRFLWPVFNTFVHALPHTYRDVQAPDGTHLKLRITGDASRRVAR